MTVSLFRQGSNYDGCSQRQQCLKRCVLGRLRQTDSDSVGVTCCGRQTVPNASCGDRKGSVSDRWQPLTADNQRRWWGWLILSSARYDGAAPCWHSRMLLYVGGSHADPDDVASLPAATTSAVNCFLQLTCSALLPAKSLQQLLASFLGRGIFIWCNKCAPILHISQVNGRRYCRITTESCHFATTSSARDNVTALAHIECD